jgi:hypothetical protein
MAHNTNPLSVKEDKRDVVVIVPELSPLPTEGVFDKLTMSPFEGDALLADTETICDVLRSRPGVRGV